jgi:hypothetical protein
MKSIWDFKVEQFLHENFNEAPMAPPSPQMNPSDGMLGASAPAPQDQAPPPENNDTGDNAEDQAKQLMSLAQQIGLSKKGLLIFLRKYKDEADKGLQPTGDADQQAAPDTGATPPPAKPQNQPMPGSTPGMM